MFESILENYLKVFFILTPFFILSSFLSMTSSWSEKDRRNLAIKVTIAIMIIALTLFFIGRHIFAVFGITLESFKVGTGALLFLSAVSMIQGKNDMAGPSENEDIAVVPLAMPIAVGPAVTGTIMVLGVELVDLSEKITGVISITGAVLSIGILLFLSGYVEKLFKKKGLNILSKITGLVLAALSAQMILGGIKVFLKM